MADSNTQLQWTDEQWNKVRQVVYEEARKARVAGNFLPLYGPLEPDATYVTKESLVKPNDANDQGDTVDGFTVADTSVLKLTTLQVKVYLKGAQVADPELTSALIAFRRAANIVARAEDEIIFNGQPKPSKPPATLAAAAPGAPPYEIRGGEETPGLLKAAPAPGVAAVAAAAEAASERVGEQLVAAVSAAIGELEQRYHLGPFACVLDQNYFTAVQTPTPSLVLPQDRILPFLGGGALVRSSPLPPNTGLVIALGGAPIDLVVATDISVNFLQVTEAPFFVFRVYEKIVLRIKQPEAIVPLPTGLQGPAGGGQPPAEGSESNPDGMKRQDKKKSKPNG